VTVLVVGGGGREHALIDRLATERPGTALHAAPGNAGIAALATCHAVAADDVAAIAALARDLAPRFVLVGPEAPLAAGLADRLHTDGVPVFGPTAAAARLETSKRFAKELMIAGGVPTARASFHTDPAEARRAARALGAPVVIKDDRLAAGKGVVVATSVDDADAAIAMMLDGSSGAEVLVEEWMAGEELSLFVVTDGTHAVPLPAAQDHKRVGEGDTGPNTGGMGAYAPVSVATDGVVATVLDRIVAPTLAAMRERRTPFRGLLYVGVMLTAEGPKVVEFNCRFGDPETQAVLPLLADPVTDLLEVVACGGSLAGARAPHARTGAAVTTVVAAAGYPGPPRLGGAIDLSAVPGDVRVYHAGTARGADGALTVRGGRVLAVTAVRDIFAAAQQASRAGAAAVRFDGAHFRGDIGWREAARRAGTP
jgi:phosphoribosylamine--glycine ligase